MKWINEILMNAVGTGGGSGTTSTNILELEIIPPNKLDLVNKQTEELACDEPVSKTFTAPECQRIHKIYATTADGLGYSEIPVTNNKEMTVSFPDMKFPRNIRVIYTNDSVAITVRTGTGGTTDKDGSDKVCRGKDYSITITPSTGYEVDFVTDNNANVSGWADGTIDLTNVQNPHNIEVAFKKKSYSVSVSAGSGGSASPTSETVEHGQDFTFAISPNSGFRVASVTANGSNVSFSQTGGNVTVRNITENQLIRVLFEVSTIAVTISSTGSGTISPSGTQNVQIGNNLDISMNPTSGYFIGSITVNGVSQTISNATGGTFRIPNITSSKTVVINYLGVRQSFGFAAYPANNVIYPVAYRNSGLEIWKSARSGDPATLNNQGAGVNNPVNSLRYYSGSSLNNLSQRSSYSTTKTDFRDKMGMDNDNQFHRVLISRQDGGYVDIKGRVGTITNGSVTKPMNIRTVRVWIDSIDSQGRLVFKLQSGMQNDKGDGNTTGATLNLTINGETQTVSNNYGVQTITYRATTKKNYLVNATMKVTGESETYECRGTFRII